MLVICSSGFGSGFDIMVEDGDWFRTHRALAEVVKSGQWDLWDEGQRSAMFATMLAQYTLDHPGEDHGLTVDDWQFQTFIKERNPLEAEEVEKGDLWRVREYDGNEWIEVFNPKYWTQATE